jgi:raffinose/stachyose/melibiose transport system permease protein
MTAFVFAHIKFAANKFLYNYFLLGLMFPFATAILPLFLRVRDFGLLGTSWAVILPQIAFGLGFSIILFRGFFRQMPREIFDAAFVDGCSYYQFYFRFTLPLSTPIIATVSVITLTGSWNNYLLPLIMINDESLYSWPMGIMVFRGEYFTDWGKILAYVSLTLLPAVIFFFALQKYIVAGLTGGAVKE